MRQIAQQIGADPDAEDSEEGASATVSLLRELQDHVESIDHASDLATVGGMAPLLRCLGSRQPAVAAAAAEVLATAVQNNPKAQGEALAAGALGALLAGLAAERPEAPEAAAKALLALSCLLRGCEPAQGAFRAASGFALLRARCGDADPRAARKALQIARFLATSHVDHLPAMVPLDFEAAATAAAESPLRDVREAALGLLVAIAVYVDFEAHPAAAEQLRRRELGRVLVARRAALDADAAAEGPEAGEEEAGSVQKLLEMLAPVQ